MFKVKLSLARMTVLAKIAKAREVVTGMTGNASLPTPMPALAPITTAADEAEAAVEVAASGAKKAKAALREKEVVLDKLLKGEASYVDYASNGVESVILSSGFEAMPTKHSQLPKPEPPFAVSAISNMTPGELLVRFKSIKKSPTYLVQVSGPSVDGSINTNTWTLLGFTTKRSIVAKGLVAGAYYGFKMAAIASAGQSDWSEIAVGKVAF